MRAGAGFENACETLVVLGAHIDGGMRERLLVPGTALHPSSTLSLDELALVEPFRSAGMPWSEGRQSPASARSSSAPVPSASRSPPTCSLVGSAPGSRT